MNFRKNNVLIVGGSIAVLLLAGAVALLFVNQGAYRDHIESFRRVQQRLDSLNSRNPFPSAENVELAKQNLALLKSEFDTLQGQLIQEQILAEKIEPARFARMLEDAVVGLRERAGAARMTLPAEPGLGFKDYAAGKLPPNDPAVLERLVVQIKALENLVSLAIESGVRSVDSLQRDDFELRTEAPAEEAPESGFRGRGRGAMTQEPAEPVAGRSIVPGVPMPADNPEYRVERFVIGVTGLENSIWDFLNRLMRSKVTYTIADITLENTRTDHGRPVDLKPKLLEMEAAAKASRPTGAPGPQVKVENIPLEDRGVGGRSRDVIRARVVVDMYRFANETSAEAQP